MTDWPTDVRPAVYVVDGDSETVRNIEGLTTRLGWRLEALATVSLTAGSGRKLRVLPRLAASDLYVALHRGPVATVAFSKVSVRRSPSGQLQDNRVLSLAEFVRYKSFYSAHPADLEEFARAFQAWIDPTEAGCEDHRDPRCLPLHMFEPKAEHDLDLAGERARFVELHRSPGPSRHVRLDRQDRTWSPAPAEARHGREPTTVSGTRLPDGFHWDVQHRKNSTWRVSSPDVVWQVKGYINIYPDGAVRQGDRCYLNWNRKDSAQADAAESRRR